MADLILVLLTMVVLVLSAKQDIKERMIYVFPVIVLYLAWSSYLLLINEWPADYLVMFWIIHLIIYVLLNRHSIWGRGDSDLFLLFGNISLFAAGAVDGYTIAIKECIYLAVGLVVSIVVGLIENRVRHKEVKLTGEIAVVPGVAIVLIGLMIAGTYRRWM